MKLNWKGIFLWSNQFYGCCAVVLTIASAQLLIHEFPPCSLLLLIYLSTILYYTHAYIIEQKNGVYNERSQWYHEHRKYLIFQQIVFSLVCFYLAFAKFELIHRYLTGPLFIQLSVALTAIFSTAYYLPNYPLYKIHSYRSNGIFKSIGIALVWCSFCCLIPIWLMQPIKIILIINQSLFWLYQIQLFTFLFILAVLFDYKDFNTDQSHSVNTIVVRFGFANTLKYLVWPLLIFYLILSFFQFYLLGYDYIYLLTELFFVGLIFFISKQLDALPDIAKNIIKIDGLIIIKAILSIISLK